MPTHLLQVAWFPWGHLSSSLGLAMLLVRKFPDLTVSFGVDKDFVEKAADELTRICADDEEKSNLVPRIRLIAAGSHVETLQLMKARDMDARDIKIPPPESVHAALRVLNPVMKDERVTDDNGIEWKPVGRRPTLILSDMMLGRVTIPLKEQFGVTLWLWFAGSAVGYTRWMGPIQLGGKFRGWGKEVVDAFENEELRAGRSFNEMVQQVRHMSPFREDLVRVPGLLPFYQWEHFAQDVFAPFNYDMHVMHEKIFMASDGSFLASVPELEPEGFTAAREWSVSEKRMLIAVGPRLTLRQLASSAEVDDPALLFLTQALPRHKTHSVLYISFGSLFFPKPAQLRALLEVLMEMKMPFVMTAAAARAPLPEELLVTIKASGLGIIVPWAPQMAILAHPATGWMLTHSGAGGTYEALSQGVPLICWPHAADQHQHASLVVDNLKVGYELLQVRTGPAGSRKAFRGDTQVVGTEEAIKGEMRAVLSAAQGEDGMKKRENARVAQRGIHGFLTGTGPLSELEKLRPFLEKE